MLCGDAQRPPSSVIRACLLSSTITFLLVSLHYWKWTVRFAAGQLSWTISVVTGLWSQVVSSVYHKDLIWWSSGAVPGAWSAVKHFTLAFSLRHVRQPLLSRAWHHFLWEALGPSYLLGLFFSPCSPCLLVSPLGNCQSPPRLILLTRMESAVFLLFGSVSVSTSRACLTPCEVTGSSSLQKPTNKSSAPLHVLPLDCSFYPNLTMETNSAKQGAPHSLPKNTAQLCRYLKG